MKRTGLALGMCLLLAATTASAAGWEDLPPSLQQTLAEPEQPFMTYVRWSEARGHPLVVRALELRADDAMPSIDLVRAAYGSLFAVLDTQVVDEGDVDEVWIPSRKPDSAHFERAWLRCDLSEPVLVQQLEDQGWQEAEGSEGRVWRPPVVRSEDGAFDHLAGEQREEAVRMLAEAQPSAEVLGEGWLLVWSSTSGGSESETADTDRVEEPLSEDDLRFPFDRLAEPETGVLLVVAADLPQASEKDEDADEVEPTDGPQRRPEELDSSTAVVDEMRKVEARLRTLRRRPEASAEGMLADFAATLTETDGGLALWIEARCSDPDVADMTSAMLSAFISAVRVMVFHASRNLWWELGSARIDVHGESVLMEVRASSSSLLEALDNEVERKREMEELRERSRELYRRMEELREERREQAVEAPS